MAMDLLPQSFSTASEALDKFVNSNPKTVEINLKNLIEIIISPQDLAKDSIEKESLNKALAVLTNFWDQRLEIRGLKLARILMEAGADPYAQLYFTEVNYWARPAQSDAKSQGNSTKGRISETMFQSTAFEEAQGKLKALLQDCAARSNK